VLTGTGAGGPGVPPAHRLAEIARATRGTSLLAAVLLAGAALGLLVAVALAPSISLRYEPTGIAGWLSRHGHAKETDVVRFALLVALPIAGAMLAWLLWIAGARTLGSLGRASIPFLLAPAIWTLAPPGTTTRGPFHVLAVGLATLAAAAICAVLAERWLVARDRGVAPGRSSLLAAFAAGAAFAVVWRIRVSTPQPYLPWLLAAGLLGIALDTGFDRLRPGAERGRWRSCVWSALSFAAPVSLLPVPLPIAAGAPVLAAVALALLARKGRLSFSARAARTASVVAACAVLYALLADLVLATIWSGAVDLYHEGESLLPAAAYARGATPYLDVAPLHGYFANGGFTRIAFSLLGETVEARRIAEWILHPLGPAAVLALAFAALRSGIVAAAGVLLVLAVPLRPELRHAFGLASSALLLAGIGGGSILPFLLAGAAGSIAFLVSLDVGLYAIAGGILFLAAYALLPGDGERRREGRRGLFAFAAGAGAIGGAWAIWLASQGALDEFLRHTFREVPRSQTAIWGSPLPDLFGVWRGVPILGDLFPSGEAQAYEALAGRDVARFTRDFLSLPAVLLAGLLFLLARGITGRWGTREWKGMALAVTALLALRSAVGQPDRVHFAFALPWAWVLFLQVVESAVLAVRAPREGEETGGEGRAILAAAFLLAFAGFVRTCDPWGYWQGSFAPEAQEEARGGGPRWLAPRPDAEPVSDLPRLGKIRIPEDQSARLLALKRFFDAAAPPQEPVYDFANAGALLFLLERPNPTRFAQAIYASSPRYRAEVVRALEEKRVRWAIVRGGGMDVISEVSNAERLPEVWAYLQAHFRPAGAAGGFEIWERAD